MRRIYNGRVLWQGSEAARKLEIDMAAGKHLELTSTELCKTRLHLLQSLWCSSYWPAHRSTHRKEEGLRANTRTDPQQEEEEVQAAPRRMDGEEPQEHPCAI